jgi:glycosyltransferase involved in cell wall biosynthesis
MPPIIPTDEAGLISVIIPCYNAEQTLSETVDCVLRQTYKKWEIIIVNDGSTDSSPQLAEKLTAFGNIKVIHTPNRGVSNARNTGAENAKGEFLAFLDADDVWQPEKLQLQINYFSKQPLLGVCFSKVRFTSQSGKSLNQYSLVPKKPLNAYSLLVENHLCTSSNIMCRKQVFLETTGFDPSMNYAEDQEWLLRVALNKRWLIAGVPEVLLDYRTQTGSLSSSLYKMEQGWQALIQKVKGYDPDFVDQHYLRAQATYLRYLARRALRQGEPAQLGLNYMKRALLSDWTILIISPWRSLATLTALVFWLIAPSKHTAQLFQISKY